MLAVFENDLIRARALYRFHLKPIQLNRIGGVRRIQIQDSTFEFLDLAREVVAIFHNDHIVPLRLSNQRGACEKDREHESADDWVCKIKSCHSVLPEAAHTWPRKLRFNNESPALQGWALRFLHVMNELFPGWRK